MVNAIIASRDVLRSAPRIAHRDRLGAPDLQTGGAQLLDDAACQGLDIASRVLLDRCDNDALDLGLLWNYVAVSPTRGQPANIRSCVTR